MVGRDSPWPVTAVWVFFAACVSVVGQKNARPTRRTGTHVVGDAPYRGWTCRQTHTCRRWSWEPWDPIRRHTSSVSTRATAIIYKQTWTGDRSDDAPQLVQNVRRKQKNNTTLDFSNPPCAIKRRAVRGPNIGCKNFSKFFESHLIYFESSESIKARTRNDS